MGFLPDWRDEVRFISDLMRDISREQDPQKVAVMYGEKMRTVFPRDRLVTVSRRGLEWPFFRITRNTDWTEEIDPWKQKDRLPLLKGGFVADLLYGNDVRIIQDLRVPEDDPAAEHLRGMCSLFAIPQFDNGEAVNMVLALHAKPDAVDTSMAATMVWNSNLYGRGTLNLVLRRELNEAYQEIDRELKVVGELQRSLLPAELPQIPGLDLAAAYEPSKRAGGDYYDVFRLPGEDWGFFIADVSGHGTPAAVMMAITHAIAHSIPEPITPGEMLAAINERLVERYTGGAGSFVTAFYGVYRPRERTLTYASAGHNPPRLRYEGSVVSLDSPSGLPLGIMPQEWYPETCVRFGPTDLLLLYTDGITETFAPGRGSAGGGREAGPAMYGTDRLDSILASHRGGAKALVDAVQADVRAFSDGAPAVDDRTLLAMTVTR